MIVAAVNNHLYVRGGAERVMFDEAQWMRGRGQTIRLFGRSRTGIGSFQDRDLFPPTVNWASASGLGRVLVALDIIYNRKTGRLFREFLQRAKPDVVHCHNIYAGLTTSVLDACREHSCRVVLTLHDYKLVCPSYSMVRRGRPCNQCVGGRYYKCAMARCHKNSFSASLVSSVEGYFNALFAKYLQADALVAPSRFLLGIMMEHGIPAAKVRYIPNGVDVNSIRPAAPGSGYYLYVGRLSHEKGLSTLIKSSARAKLPLRIIGDGPERARLMQEAASCGSKNVSFEGHKPSAEVRQIMRDAQFIVVPSEWYENASMTVLEAMACAKPVIATRIGGLPEQIVDRETGLLCEPANPDELGDAIARLASNHVLCRKMGEAGRSRVEKHFSLDLHCERMLALYEGRAVASL